MKLWEMFLEAETTELPWRIYGQNTHKLLCADYRNLKDDDNSLDELKVVKAIKNEKFWRIVVKD